MSNKVKDIDIQNPACYSSNAITFDPNNIKKDEKSYKNILVM